MAYVAYNEAVGDGGEPIPMNVDLPGGASLYFEPAGFMEVSDDQMKALVVKYPGVFRVERSRLAHERTIFYRFEAPALKDGEEKSLRYDGLDRTFLKGETGTMSKFVFDHYNMQLNTAGAQGARFVEVEREVMPGPRSDPSRLEVDDKQNRYQRLMAIWRNNFNGTGKNLPAEVVVESMKKQNPELAAQFLKELGYEDE